MRSAVWSPQVIMADAEIKVFLAETPELSKIPHKAQELCESRSGCPGLPVPNKPDGFCGCKATPKRKRFPLLSLELISEYISAWIAI